MQATDAGAATRLILVNPAASSGRTRGRWPRVWAALQAAGVEGTVAETAGPGDATRIVREHVRAGGTEVVVVGGDGTLNEAVGGLLDEQTGELLASGVTIAVVHQGTGGDLARGQQIPKDLEGAVATAADGSLRTVDLGVATFDDASGRRTTRAFISCANVGMGADVVAKVTGRLKQLGNSGAFAVAAVGSILRNRPRRVALRLDGEESQAEIVDVMVANNRYVGGGMLVAPDARIDDGRLDVIVVGAASRLTLVRTFPRIYRGTHVHHRIVRHALAREVVLEAPDDPQGVVLDGELVGRTPVTFRIIPGALRLRVPAGDAGR